MSTEREIKSLKQKKKSEMNEFDLIIERKISKSELKYTISKSLNLSENSIILTNDYVDTPFSEKIKVWHIVNDIDGDFSLICQIFIRDQNIKYDSDLLAKRISFILNSKCLMSDDSQNPLTWNMIFPSGLEKSISLNPDKTEDGIYLS